MDPLTTESNPTRSAAADYAARGFRVIAIHRVGPDGKTCSCHKGANCPSAGKHPVVNEWQTAAPLTEAELDHAFGGDRPRNIGIATGPDSGIFVVDIDPKDGGFESMKALAAEHGKDWASGYRVQTGSKGVHLYFRYPDFEVGNKAGTVFGSGIDVRGLGGQVVAPPSRSSKGEYVLQRDVEIPEAPGWMLDMLRPKERKASTIRDYEHDLGHLDRLKVHAAEARRLQGYVDGALEHELGRLDQLRAHAVPPGQPYLGAPWDATTYEVAANLLELANADWNDLTHDTVEALILEHAPKPDGHGWTLDRVHEKIESARRKVEHEAAAYPEVQPDPFAEFVSRSANPTVPPIPEPATSLNADEDDEPFGFADEGPKIPEAIEVAQHYGGVPVVDGRLAPGAHLAAAADAMEGLYHERIMPPVAYAQEVGLDQLLDHPQLDDSTDVEPFTGWVEAHIRSGSPEAFWAALGHVLRGIPADDVPPLVLRGCDGLLLALTRAYSTLVDPEGEAILLGPPIYTLPREGALIIEFDPLAPPAPVEGNLGAIAAKALGSEGSMEVVAPEQVPDSTFADRRAASLERRRRGITPTKRGSDHAAL